MAQFLILLMHLIRPLLGPSNCRFAVGCTTFTLDQLHHKPLWLAIKNSTLRVLSCNPFTKNP